MLYKTLFILSIISAFAVLLYGGAGPVLFFSPTAPTFTNPFSDTIVGNASYFADGPSKIDQSFFFYSPPSFVGCTNNSYSRVRCINTDDGEGSYIRFHFGDVSYQAEAVLFNITPPGLIGAGHMSVTQVTFTISCRTVRTLTNVSPLFDFVIGGGGMGDAIGTPFTSCPVSDGAFQRMIYTVNYPGGINNLSNTQGFNAYIFASHRDAFNNATARNGTLDISYIRVDLQLGTVATCEAPQGAWIPGLDVLGCIFGRIWQLSLNVILWIVGWFIFGGQIVINAVTVIVWLYAIPNMPSIIQTFVSAVVTIWLIVVAFEIYKKISPFS